MIDRFYVYQFLRTDGTPYYVGKGSGNRIWLKKGRPVKAPPRERKQFIIKNLDEQTAFAIERFWIKVFGRKDLGTGILHNKSDGGEGPSGCKHKPCTQEHKEKIRNALLGSKQSNEAKAKRSAWMKQAWATGQFSNRKKDRRTKEVAL